MPLAKSSVDVEILFDHREQILGPSGPVWRDVEKIPSGFRFALREINDSVEPGEEKVLKRQIGQGVGTIEKAKERALLVKPPKVKRVKDSSASGAPERKTYKRRKTTGIEAGIEALFGERGIKPAYRNKIDKMVADLVKEAGA